jgi:farnesyl-diphosphate farnesyltransferase
MMSLREEALRILEETSRTFFIPISRLPPGLLEAVGSGYLCMRAIDEIEDHPVLDRHTKESILREISQALQSRVDVSLGSDNLGIKTSPHRDVLPEVTLRLDEWTHLAPGSIAPRIWDATATMADRMAHWAASNWEIHTLADLDRYTFSVAGVVGLLLSDLWAWYDGTQTDRVKAVGFGRGLQAVNILRNRPEDLARGVDFYPDDWSEEQMYSFTYRNLAHADEYICELPPGPVMDFCSLPLILAHRTLDVLTRGERKLNRGEVLKIIAEATAESGEV